MPLFMLQSARSRGHRVAVFLVTVLALVLAPVLAPMRQAWAKAATPIPDPQRIEVPGYPDAFYYRPRVRGMRPVIMYLHGRGGNPMEECRKWAKVATQFGWVVCPQGPVDKGGGARAWDNNAIVGGQIADATVKALRAKYKRRVQLHGNVLIGFSEGAFVAIGHHPATELFATLPGCWTTTARRCASTCSPARQTQSSRIPSAWAIC